GVVVHLVYSSCLQYVGWRCDPIGCIARCRYLISPLIGNLWRNNRESPRIPISGVPRPYGIAASKSWQIRVIWWIGGAFDQLRRQNVGHGRANHINELRRWWQRQQVSRGPELTGADGHRYSQQRSAGVRINLIDQASDRAPGGDALVEHLNPVSHLYAQSVCPRDLPADRAAPVSAEQAGASPGHRYARRLHQPCSRPADGSSDQLTLYLPVITDSGARGLPKAIRGRIGVQHHAFALDDLARLSDSCGNLQPQPILLHCALGPTYSCGEVAPQQQVQMFVVPRRAGASRDIAWQSPPYGAGNKPARRFHSICHHLDIWQLGGVGLPVDEAVDGGVAPKRRMHPAVVLVSLPVSAVAVVQL